MERGQVEMALVVFWPIPDLVSALVTITPFLPRTTTSVLYAIDWYTTGSFFGISRVLADGDDRGAFRLMLFSALSAPSVSTVWNASF